MEGPEVVRANLQSGRSSLAKRDEQLLRGKPIASSNKMMISTIGHRVSTFHKRKAEEEF